MKHALLSSFLASALVEAVFSGHVEDKSIQEKVRLADTIVIARVHKIRSVNVISGKDNQNVAECHAGRVIKGDIFDYSISICHEPAQSEAYAGLLQRPLLKEGENYILFLRRSEEGYRLISPYHGTIPIADRYAVLDEDGKNVPSVLRRTSSLVDGIPSVTLSHADLIHKIERLVCPLEVEEFAIEGPVPLWSDIEVPKHVEKTLLSLKAEGRSDHFPLLLEYGLRTFLENLRQTRLARELPIESNAVLAELVRLAEIPKYRSAHQAGWLDRQFDFHFAGTGYSSYQIWIWYLEQHFSFVSSFPNEDRLMALDEQIGKTEMQGVGGGRVCHYGCR